MCLRFKAASVIKAKTFGLALLTAPLTAPLY